MIPNLVGDASDDTCEVALPICLLPSLLSKLNSTEYSYYEFI